MVVCLPTVVQENLRFVHIQSGLCLCKQGDSHFTLLVKRAGLPTRHHRSTARRAGRKLREEPSLEMMDTKQVRQSLLKDRAVMDAIRRRAHQLSVERGYSTPQHMAEDWFRAENEVLDKLVEEEIKRRQKMNAAISEGAMAEEAVPAVVLPPSLAESLNTPRSGAKKPSARRKKADAATKEAATETAAPAASGAPASPTDTSPAAGEVTPSQSKRKRKSSVALAATDTAVPADVPALPPAASVPKPKAAARSKASRKKIRLNKASAPHIKTF